MKRATQIGQALKRAVGWISKRLAPFQRLLWPAEQLVTKRYGVVGPLAVALAAGVVLGQLGAVLAGLHIPGADSYTITDLTDTGFRLPSPDHAADVIRTWQEVPIAEGYRGPETSVWSFAVVDFALFAPAYALLLGVVLLKLRGSLQTAGSAGKLDETARRRLMRRGQDPTDELLEAERTAINDFREADIGLIKFALLLVPLLFVLDEAENVLIPAVYHAGPTGDGFTGLFVLLAAAAWFKWAIGIVLVISLLVATLAAASLAPDRVGRLWTALVVLRPQLLLLAFYAAGLFGVEQSADVILRWSEDPLDAVAAVVLTACFGAVALASARLLLEELPPPEKDVPEGKLIAAGVVLLAAAVAGELLWGFGLGLAVPGALLLVVVGLSALAGQPALPRRVRNVGRFGQVLPMLLGGLPLVLLGLAALRTSVPEVAYAANDGFLVLGAVGLALMAVGWALVLRRKRRLEKHGLKIMLRVALGVSGLLALRIYLNPWRMSEALGSIGILAGFTVAATLVAFGLVFLAERYEPPSVFALLRLKRTPVFVLLAIWALAAAKTDPDGSYYDVRTIPQSERAAAMSRPEIVFERVDPGRRDAFDEWAAARPQERPAVPLVFVAAAGGGIRAGYWVATVLDCVLEGRGDDPACSKYGDDATERAAGSVFAASGISGGSVGLAAYATHLRYRPEDPAWREDRLGDDYIAPMIGWALFVDAPLAFLRRDGGEDRAAILERAFERSWVEDIGDRGTAGFFWKRGANTDSSPLAAGIFDLWARRQRREEPPLPLLLLNGTKVQDGCRLNASVFDASVEYPRGADARPAVARLAEDCLALRLFEVTPPGTESIYVEPAERAQWTFASTEDLSDFVCAEDDVRLSTAALLSARFPFALPSGRLEKCRTPGAPAINVVDGGYFDTSGASPLVELWTELEPEVDLLNADAEGPCIVPFFLQIDTGYSDPTGVSQARPLEAAVPLTTAKSARNAREANARQAAALAFSGPFGRVGAAKLAKGMDVDRFAHIYPRAHPGSKAPLGWTLSRTARRDLDRQLSVNSAEISKVRDWFNASLRCDRGEVASGTEGE